MKLLGPRRRELKTLTANREHDRRHADVVCCNRRHTKRGTGADLNWGIEADGWKGCIG